MRGSRIIIGLMRLSANNRRLYYMRTRRYTSARAGHMGVYHATRVIPVRAELGQGTAGGGRARFLVGNPAKEFTVNLRRVRGLDHKTDSIKELGVIEAADAQPIADIRNLDHRARLRLWPLSRHDRIT